MGEGAIHRRVRHALGFESVYLSQRIVVMAARPGRIIADLRPGAPFPRGATFRTSPDYAAACRMVSDKLVEAIAHDRRAGWHRRHAGTPAAVIVEERRWLGLTSEAGRRLIAPVVIGAVVLGLWEAIVRQAGIPPYILPGPWLILRTLISDWGTLSGSLWITLEITGLALLAAVLVGGCCRSCSPSRSGWRLSLFPYAVILQVTPIVAIAPLIIIWVDDIDCCRS